MGFGRGCGSALASARGGLFQQTWGGKCSSCSVLPTPLSQCPHCLLFAAACCFFATVASAWHSNFCRLAVGWRAACAGSPRPMSNFSKWDNYDPDAEIERMEAEEQEEQRKKVCHSA